MREPYTQLYIHYVWATWDRLPLVTPQVEARVYSCIADKCRELKCEPIAIGGMEDHIHLMVRFPATLTPAVLIGEVKGTSSHLMSHVITPGVFFKWQGAYGAFTVPKSGASNVASYIANQKAHHGRNNLVPEWEICEIKSDKPSQAHTPDVTRL